MLLAARETLALTSALTFEEMAEDRQTQLAVLKLMEIIGEAAAHVGDSTRQAHPTIPWREIEALPKRVTHAHFNIDLVNARKIISDELPSLTAHLQRLVPPEDE